MSGSAYEECPFGIKHETEIIELKRCYEVVSKDVKEIKERLLSRPSWFVTLIITLLSTLAFSSLTFSFTVLHGMVK